MRTHWKTYSTSITVRRSKQTCIRLWRPRRNNRTPVVASYIAPYQEKFFEAVTYLPSVRHTWGVPTTHTSQEGRHGLSGRGRSCPAAIHTLGMCLCQLWWLSASLLSEPSLVPLPPQSG